jgi:hypothetical protein
MPEIVLTDDQARVVTEALKPVCVKDSKGNVIGTITPIWSEKDIAEAKKVLAEKDQRKWYTTQEVLSHLRSLGDK